MIDMSTIDMIEVQPETTVDVAPSPAPAGESWAITLDMIRALAAAVGIPEPAASAPRRTTAPRATSASTTPRVLDLGCARLPTTAALLLDVLRPREGARHDLRLATAGWLLAERRLDEAVVIDVLERSATTEEGASDAAEVVGTTAARIASGRPVMASHAMTELLGDGRRRPLTTEARATMWALEAALRTDLGEAAIAAVAQLAPAADVAGGTITSTLTPAPVAIEAPVGTTVPVAATAVPTPIEPAAEPVSPFIDGAPGRTSTGALGRTASALRVALIVPPVGRGPVEVNVATQRAAIALAVAALLNAGGVPVDVATATAAEAGVSLRADAVASAAAARPLPALRRDADQSLGHEWVATILAAAGADLRASVLDEESARAVEERLLAEWAHRLTPAEREFLGLLADRHPDHPATRTIERAQGCGKWGELVACPNGHGDPSLRIFSTDREVLCPHCHLIARQVYEMHIGSHWTETVITLRVRLAASSIPADDRERLTTAASRLRAVAEAPRAERRAMGPLRARWVWGREEFIAVVGHGLDPLESDLPTLEAYASALRALGHDVDGPRIVSREEAGLDVVDVLDGVTTEAQRLLAARDPLLVHYEWLLPRAKRTAAVAPRRAKRRNDDDGDDGQQSVEDAPRPRSPLSWPTRATKGGTPSEFARLRREVVRRARGQGQQQQQQPAQDEAAARQQPQERAHDGTHRCKVCDHALQVRMIDLETGATVGGNAAGIRYTCRDLIALRTAQRIRIGRRE